MLITELTAADRNRLPETIKNIEAINVDAFLQAAESWLSANPASSTNQDAEIASMIAAYKRGEISTAGSPLFSPSELESMDADSLITGDFQILSEKPFDRTVNGSKRKAVKVKFTAATSTNVVAPIVTKKLGQTSTLYLNDACFEAMEKGTFRPYKGTSGKFQITLVVSDTPSGGTRKGPWPQMTF